MKLIFYLFAIVVIAQFVGNETFAQVPIIRMQAGIAASSGYSGDGGQALAAHLTAPSGIAVDRKNNLYFSDATNSVIRRVTPDGIISIYAGILGTNVPLGTGDGGPATNAVLNTPYGLAVDTLGNLYIAESGNFAVRKVDTGGIITFFAGIGGTFGSGSDGDGGPATAARLTGAMNIVFDKFGSLFISDNNMRVRKVSASGIISTVAGCGAWGNSGNGGPATAAAFRNIAGIAVDTFGNLFIADYTDTVIRRVDTAGIIHAYFGPGTMGVLGDGGLAGSAHMANAGLPVNLATDIAGNLYFSDWGGQRIRKISHATSVTSTVAGTGLAGISGEGGPATAAKIWNPSGLCFNRDGAIIFSDNHNAVIRMIMPMDTVAIFKDSPDTICGHKLVTFHANVKNAGYGDTLRWVKNGITVGGNTFVFSTDSINNGDNICCIMWAPGGGKKIDTSNVFVFTVHSSPSLIVGNSQLCMGVTATLTDVTTGGTWVNTNPLVTGINVSTGVVTPLSYGIDSIYYVLSTGCSALKIVTVNPAAGVIIGPHSICTNNATTLSNVVTGGTWISSDTSIARVSSSGIVQGLSIGFATISYSVTGGCVATSPVSVNIPPTPIVGDTSPLCGNTSRIFTDSVSGGTWISTNPSLATFDSAGRINGHTILGGIDTVIYALPSGCQTRIKLHYLPAPSPISGSTDICIGSVTTLHDALTGGTWSLSDTVHILFNSTGVVRGLSIGFSTVTYSISNGCYSITNLEVDSTPVPITGSGTVCTGLSSTLHQLAVGGVWYASNNFAHIDSSTGILSGTIPGIDTITYLLDSGCYVTKIITINPSPGSISGVTSSCIGVSTNLIEASTGGNWISINPSIASVTSTGVVSAFTSDTTTIAYVLPDGCARTVLFNVKPTPAGITGSNIACVGQTTTLSNSVSGGIWASSNTNAIIDSTGVVTGFSLGIDTIFYTLGSGCFKTKSVSVSPSPAPITGTDSVCTSMTISVGESVTGGVWSSSDTMIGTVNSSGLVKGKLPSIFFISYTLPAGCSVSKQVKVNPQPSPIIGNISLCPGFSSTLNDTLPGGFWSSGTSTVGSITTGGVFTGNFVGTTLISYSFPTGCFASVVATINQVPAAISGSSSVCNGKTTMLSDLTTGGKWRVSDTAINYIDSVTGVVTGKSVGSDTVFYSINGVGCFVTRNITINQSPAPINGISSMCKRTSVNLTDSTSGGRWSSGNPSVAAIDSITGLVTGISEGTTNITFTLISGCNSMSVLNVLPAPDSISGVNIICANTISNYSNLYPGGNWALSNNIATVDTNGNITALQEGIDTLNYSLGQCAVTKIITVNAAPTKPAITIKSPNQLCSNTLYQNFGTIPPSVNINYNWRAANAIIWASGIGHQYCLVNFESAGDVLVILNAKEIATGCTSEDTFKMNIGTNASEDIDVAYLRQYFVCMNGDADTYQWGYDDASTLDSTIIPGETYQEYFNDHPASGVLYWVITTKNGCMQKSYYKSPLFVTNTEGDESLKVYPNPSVAGNFKVEFPQTPFGICTFFVYDILGNTVFEKQTSGERVESFSLNNLEAGTYFIKVVTGANTFRSSLQIMR